jgi:hypothetical protein
MTLCASFNSFLTCALPKLFNVVYHCLSWLDGEQATLQFCAERLFALMDGTWIEKQVIEQHPECLLLLSTWVEKLIRKSYRAEGMIAYFHGTFSGY